MVGTAEPWRAFDSAAAARAAQHITSDGAALVSLSHEIADDPELAYQEVRAARRCVEFLEAKGMSVEASAFGLDTAFRATAGTEGPHVLLCAEYDALPGMGHACGHNIIAAAAVGAGAALARVAEEAGLRVTVLGTPAEETGGGKIQLMRAGALEGIDFALMIHPAPFDMHDARGRAVEDWDVEYLGRASHSSATPYLGRNALDGVVAGYTAIAMLRQHLHPSQQVHGVITAGGEASNVVPDRTRVRYTLRADDVSAMGDLRARVRACLEGSAMATGTSVGIEQVGDTYEPVEPNPGLVRTFGAACEAIGRSFAANPSAGYVGLSTDFGNISQVVPSLHADLAVHSWPVVNHEREFAARCVTETADTTLLQGAKAMALTALAVAENPEILAS